MTGWLIGLAALTAIFVLVPHLLDGIGAGSSPWAAWLRIAIGMLLIVAAVGRWLTRDRATRPPALLNRLRGITPASAALIGSGLVVANPKVLVMNAAAGLIIGAAAVGVSGWLAVAFYTALAGSTVIAPVLAYVVAGDRVDRQLERIRHWMQREQAALTAIILAIVGVMLAYTGIRAL